MFYIQYKCEKINSTEGLVKAGERKNGERELSSQYQESVLKTWENLYDYLKPGKSNDGTIALKIQIFNDEMELEKEDQDMFANLCLSGLIEIFGERNVLSVVRNNYGIHVSCTAIVFPLFKRIPQADKYLHPIKQTQPNDTVKQKIERRIHHQFDSVFVTGETKITDGFSKGYSQALIDFVPAPYRKEYDKVIPYHIPDPDTQIQTTVPYDEMNKIANSVISYFTFGPEKLLFERSQKQNSEVTPNLFMEKVEEYIKKTFPNVVRQDLNILKRRIYRAIFQNYVLEPLIDADEISDIMVLAPDNIRVKVGGERYTSDIKFINEMDYYRFIDSLATRNNLSPSNAINVFSDIDSNPNFRMRFNITTTYINSSQYPYLHIRKIAKKKRDLNYLLKAGMLDEKIAAYLIDRARNGKGLIFTGKGASGKTTLMNMLLDCIPFNKSGLVIQESEELFSDIHPHLLFEHIVTNGDGVHYDLQDLARNGLLTDLDYFVIGEVKGAEAKYFINAADTGHRCWCSVHSPSSIDAVDKLADYVMYETKYSKEEALYMLKDLGTVIFMQNFKVCEISEIAGWDFENKKLIYRPIYKRPTIR